MATSTKQTVALVEVYDYELGDGDPTLLNAPSLAGKKIKVTLQYDKARSTSPVTWVGNEPVYSAVTDQNGFWHVFVQPTDQITPSGTYYLVQVEGYRTYRINPVLAGIPGIGWQASAILLDFPGPLTTSGGTIAGPITITGGLNVQGLLNLAASGTIAGQIDETVRSILLLSGAPYTGVAPPGSINGKYFAPPPLGSGLDDTATQNAFILAVSNAGGGDIEYGSGTYLWLGAMAVPNDGQASLPRQKSLRLHGRMATGYGYWTGPGVPPGATIFDMRFNGDGGTHVAKIDTRGAGLLEIDHVAFTTGANDNFPFIQTTNTTIHGHHNAFLGNRTNSGQNCLQDAWILGGTGATFQDLGSNSYFQGYGTHLHDNFYDQIRRPVTFGAQANGLTVENETISKTCGSGTNPDAPYYFNGGGAGGGAAGGVIRGGIVEVTNYKYAFVLNHTRGWTFDCVGLYDNGGYTAGAGYADVNSVSNLVFAPFFDSASLGAFFGTSPGAGDQTVITSHHNDRTNFVRGLIVGNLDGTGLEFLGTTNGLIRLGPNGILTTINTANPLGGNMLIDTGAGGSHLNLHAFDYVLYDYNGANPIVISPASGVGRIYGSAASGISIRDSGNARDNLQIYNTGQVAAFKQLYPGAEAGAQQVTGGFLHSTGVPSNANGNNSDWCISDNGHLYFRTGGVWNDMTAAVTAQSTPGNPVGTASTTGAMMGLAGSITPIRTGNVLVIISGDIFNNTLNDGASVQIRYGTGSAPTNGVTTHPGTAAGGKPVMTATAASAADPFSVQAVVSGLTLGTAVWLDLEVAAITAGTALVEHISISAVEV
ncbi:MAG: hypothetical protein ACHQC8_02540 [Solirubrobacterales bacterium]